MLKVKDIYQFCYPLLNKHGITYALWANWFLKNTWSCTICYYNVWMMALEMATLFRTDIKHEPLRS